MSALPGPTTGGKDRDEAPPRLRRSMPDPIPMQVIGRLADKFGHQNRVLGHAQLLKAVICRLRCIQLQLEPFFQIRDLVPCVGKSPNDLPNIWIIWKNVFD